MRIEMERWGRDHWSLLAYIESRCVNGIGGIGTPEHVRIQTNLNRHPGMANYSPVTGGKIDGSEWGIRLANGETLPGPDYDEWDCIDDLEIQGLILNIGTGINPSYSMMPFGKVVASKYRAFRASGGHVNDFRYDPAWADEVKDWEEPATREFAFRSQPSRADTSSGAGAAGVGL